MILTITLTTITRALYSDDKLMSISGEPFATFFVLLYLTF